MSRSSPVSRLAVVLLFGAAAACGGPNTGSGRDGDGSGDGGNGSGDSGVRDDASDAGGDSGGGNDGGGDNGGGGDDTAAPECTSHADCAGGQLCVDSECRAACFSEADCPPDAPICDTDASLCIECASDGDCAGGETCDAGFCVDTGCTSNADCAGGQICDTGTGACTDVECTDDGDCGDGEVCDRETFQCAGAGCTSNADCAGGELCLDGACVPIGAECAPGAAECTGDFGGRECDDAGQWQEFACTGGDECVSGACVPPGTGCVPNQRYCADLDTVARCSPDGATLTEIDCLDTEVCADGFCRPDGCTNGDRICVNLTTEAVCTAGTFVEAACGPDERCTGNQCEAEGTTNACGGSDPLDAEPGDPCGGCGSWACDGLNDLDCNDPGENDCGGCGPLPGREGDFCDSRGNRWSCTTTGEMVCGEAPPPTCTTDSECQAVAEDAGSDAVASAACSGDGLCYTRGRCGGDDVFDAPCADGSWCPPFNPTSTPDTCVNCNVAAGTGCREGEVCIEVDSGMGFAIGACIDPAHPPVP